MIVIWTIIVIVTAHAPATDVFRRICAQDGGLLTMTTGHQQDAKGKAHEAVLLRCVRPKERGPPKIGV